jgi:aspartate-semialdehyde dehydrogenase
MKRVGLVGWRGMVGSVLMQRMQEEKDFDHIEPVFFTTSNVGGKGPAIGKDVPPLKDADSIDELKAWMSSSPARAATTPARSFPSCAPPAGRATGSTPPRRCAWTRTP